MAVPYYFPYPGHPGPGGKMPPFDPSFMQRYVKNAFKYILTKCIFYMYIFFHQKGLRLGFFTNKNKFQWFSLGCVIDNRFILVFNELFLK